VYEGGMRASAAVALALAMAAVGPRVAAAPAARPLRVFVAPAEATTDALTPAGQAARREGEALRAKFLDRLRKMNEVALVDDEGQAQARLEVRESAVHHRSRTETTSKRGGGRQPSGPRQFIVETQEEVGVSASDEREFALTVRITAGNVVADFASSVTEPSASSAADTVARSMARWIRAHRRELARP